MSDQPAYRLDGTDEVSGTVADSFEVSISIRDTKARASWDINFFAGLCIPHVFRFPFPSFYIALFQFLLTAIDREDKVLVEKVLRIVVGLPRGFAKSTFLKIIVCWLITHDKISFILVICATEDLAENFISDVHGILSSPNIESIYGFWDRNCEPNTKLVKKASYRSRMVILKGAGAGTAVRGLLMEHQRPDFILLDDMQTKENDESDAESKALFLWFIGTLLKVVTPFNSIIFYIGNMYSENCILAKLKDSAHWTSLITGAILLDGSSLWPELHSIQALYESFAHDEALGLGDVWFAEMMNDPVPKASALISGPLPMTVWTEGMEADAAFITIDPAGFRDGADDNVITGHYVRDRKGYIAEMEGGKLDPGTLVTDGIAMAIRIGASVIGVEDVAYQQSLLYWFEFWLKKLGITGITVVGLKTGRGSKESRIRAWLKEMYAGEYSFLRDEDRLKVTFQGTAYRSGKKKNRDDWLDSPAMATIVRNQFSHLLSMRKDTSNGLPPMQLRGNTPF